MEACVQVRSSGISQVVYTSQKQSIIQLAFNHNAVLSRLDVKRDEINFIGGGAICNTKLARAIVVRPLGLNKFVLVILKSSVLCNNCEQIEDVCIEPR